MGAFNTVHIQRLIPCKWCGDAGRIQVQFAYGNTQQLHYEIGDAIVWGGYDIGVPTGGEVLVLATPEDCQTCGAEVPEAYVLRVDNGRLDSYRLATADEIATLT